VNEIIFQEWLACGESPQIARMIGFRRTEFEVDKTVLEFETGPQHANPVGTLHGGVLCYVADTAMGTAWASRLTKGETFSTIELKMNFFRPVWSGVLVAEAKVLRRGKTVGYVECEIKDDQDRLVAKAASSCMTLRGEQAAMRRENGQ
jgi:uncharacterized protein (TIGR00369 family)